jgi:hypothetical protein
MFPYPPGEFWRLVPDIKDHGQERATLLFGDKGVPSAPTTKSEDMMVARELEDSP